jgi:hypothetical protein
MFLILKSTFDALIFQKWVNLVLIQVKWRVLYKYPLKFLIGFHRVYAPYAVPIPEEDEVPRLSKYLRFSFLPRENKICSSLILDFI